MVGLLTDESEVEGSSPVRAQSFFLIFFPHFLFFVDYSNYTRLYQIQRKNDIMRYEKRHMDYRTGTRFRHTGI